MRISYSALEVFKRCPLKFKLSQIDKIKTPKSKEALFGTLIHKILKMLHEPGLIIPTEEDILKYFSANWDASLYADEREAAMAFAQGIKILKDYYAKNYPADFNVLALETSFEAPVEHAGETHYITGKIDRVDKPTDNLYEIIDYKTTKKMPSQDAVDKDLQLAIYHLGVAHRWPFLAEGDHKVKVSLYFLKHGEKLSTLRTVEQLTETKENIIQTIGDINKSRASEKFEPRSNPLCDWCEYQRYCPLYKHKFVEKKLFFNDQDVKTLIGEYVALKDEIDKKDKRMDEIKGDLGKFMDQEGMERLFGDDGYITRQVIQRFKYDPELLRQVLEPLGKCQEILKIDDAKLKKITGELPPDIRSQVDSAKKPSKESKVFSVKKGKK